MMVRFLPKAEQEMEQRQKRKAGDCTKSCFRSTFCHRCRYAFPNEEEAEKKKRERERNCSLIPSRFVFHLRFPRMQPNEKGTGTLSWIGKERENSNLA